eukprot:m.12597 g.12597  ORF g.12597 m.12597 type:complete len:363 (-) comp5836_c0_seq2:2102-3190(-)
MPLHVFWDCVGLNHLNKIMGADGGTFPTRDELVRVKKREVQRDPQEDLDARWKFCTLSSQPLEEPIMACELGMLFNKKPLLEHLVASIEGSVDKAAIISHIKSLKDVHELRLQASPDQPDEAHTLFQCPILGLAMNGRQRFVYPVDCGCVVSEKAYKHVQSTACLQCGKPTVTEDLIPLNPSPEEMKELMRHLKERKAMKKMDKKRRKAKRKAQASEASSASEDPVSAATAISATSGVPAVEATSDELQGVSAGESAPKVAAVDGSVVEKDKEMERFREQAKTMRSRAALVKAHRKQAGQTVNVDIDKDGALGWALSGKSVADKDAASSSYKKLFHSSGSKDMNDYTTFTSRTGYSQTYTWG